MALEKCAGFVAVHRPPPDSSAAEMAGDRSYRNLVNRREHRERSQPAKRRRLGLLEKHKDYVLRARDFHRKERAITNLKRKADERNPDEFYFGMIKQ